MLYEKQQSFCSHPNVLTHLPLVSHKCGIQWVIIGLDNGLQLVQRQVII